MKRTPLLLSALAASATTAFGIDGQVLINQSAVTAAGGMYTISQTGSYKLSGNLSNGGVTCAPAGSQLPIPVQCVILVSAPDVILDLNGFTIQAGPSSSNYVGTAIVQGPAAINLTIRNGVVSFPQSCGNCGVAVGLVPFTYLGVAIFGLVNTRWEDLNVDGPAGVYLIPWAPYKMDRVFGPNLDVISHGCPGLVSNSVLQQLNTPCVSVGNSITTP